MNKRIDYKFKALTLRLLLMLVRKLACHQDPMVSGRDFDAFERDIRNTIQDCEAISDGSVNIADLMTDDQIRVAVAECCGWKRLEAWAHSVQWAGRWVEGNPSPVETATDVPNYPSDLNACAEMEKNTDQHDYRISLAAVCSRANHHPYQATARQRCEAFLRVKGKWNETTKTS